VVIVETFVVDGILGGQSRSTTGAFAGAQRETCCLRNGRCSACTSPHIAARIAACPDPNSPALSPCVICRAVRCAAGQHAFAYTVTIRNSGDIAAQLIARHWIITDANGHTEEVRGSRRRQPAAAQAGRVVRVHELDAPGTKHGTMPAPSSA